MELTSLVIAIVMIVANNFAKGEDYNATTTTVQAIPEDSTKYPILIPNNTSYDLDFENTDFFPLSNESLIDWESGFRKCGVTMDGCSGEPTDSTLHSDTPSSPLYSHSFKRNEFMDTPGLCRCDKKCVKFGDCCVSILKNMSKIPKDRYWRCVKLLNSNHAIRMISKCPPDYSDKLNKDLCENQRYPTGTNQASLVTLLDVPVLHNKTGDLYRSIFCARCHSVSKQEIYSSNYELRCSNFSSRSEFEDFKMNARYEEGKLRWIDSRNESVYCRLYFEELQPENIQKLVPDVRFCQVEAEEECPLDLNIEENIITHHLCSSYKQIVFNEVRSEDGGDALVIYKNPHCAKCKNPDIDIRKNLKCFRVAPKGRGGDMLPPMGTRYLTPLKETGPVGINILFHFSLVEDGPVGYTSKCDDNEILDFIRQKCVPMICQKGYELIEGACEKIQSDAADTILDVNETSIIAPRTTNTSAHNVSNSTASEPCLLIIFHPGEYYELTNGSITVNKSGSSGIVMFEPGEYEKYNESSMSVCAKHVEETFISSFAPALSYISNILLALSVLCSLTHVILYMILPKMRNLPGNNLLCLTSCLLISQFIFLTFIKTSNSSVCVIASVIMHYLFLSAFCWMNIMSFDIWRTFSSEFLVRRYSGDSAKTFLKYSLFAWSIPMVIVVLAVITDFYLPESVFLDPDYGPLMKKLRPLYGQNSLCWIGQRLSLFVFFAFPVALIILCNFILFTLTASTIWLQNKEGKKFISGNTSVPALGNGKGYENEKRKHENLKLRQVSSHGSNSGSTKQSDTVRFKLYAKLALIMGLTWILGFLSGFTQWDWLWYPFVIFNGLQGTFIFVAFDCKSKIWQMVKEECGLKKTKIRKSGMDGEDGSSSDLKKRGTLTLSTTLRSSSRASSTGSAGNTLILIEREKKGDIVELK